MACKTTQIKIFLLACNIMVISTSFFRNFPFGEFFDLQQNSVEEISAYLCHDSRTEMKCCSCSKTPTANWCIDIFWREKPFRNLNTYLMYLSYKYDEIASQTQYKQCAPIISPVGEHHVVEQRMMYSTYTENGITKDCPRTVTVNNTSTEETLFQTPALHESSMKTYINKECAQLNNQAQVPESWIESYNIMEKAELVQLYAECENVTDVYLGMPIKETTFEHLSKCYFSLEWNPDNDDSLALAPKCPFGKGSNCPITDLNYMLCNAYYAPMNGYRNYHCAVCDNQMSILKKLKKCIDEPYCDKGICNLRSITFTQTLKSTQGLYLDFDNLIISGFKYSFPIDDFFKDYKFEFPREHSKFCWKKDYCSKFKQCCVDHYWNFSNPISIENYQQILIDKTKHLKDHSCEKLAPYEMKASHTSYYYMVTTCLENSTSSQKLKCANVNELHLKTYLPVIGDDHYLYRNLFCAQCNSVNSYEYVKLGVDCTKDQCYTFITNENENIIQHCDVDVPSNTTCPLNHPLQELCKAFVHPTKNYKNIFCHLCNFPNKKAVFHSCCNKASKFYFSWSMLISLSDDNTGELNVIVDGTPCAIIKKIYHFLYKNTRIYTCNNSLHLEKPAFDTCFNASNEIALFIIKEKSCDYDHFNQSSDVFNILKIKNNETEIYYENDTHLVIKINQDIKFNIFSLIEMKYAFIFPFMMNKNMSFLLTQTKNPLLGTVHRFDFSNNFPHSMYCYETETLDISEADFSSSCNITTNKTVINFTDMSFQMKIDRSGIKKILQVCKRPYLSPTCELTPLKNEISINQDDGTLVHSNFKEKNIYSVSLYYPTRDGVLVCLKSSMKWIPVVKTVDVCTSIVGSFISIACYVLIIHTYRSNQRLWNTPGKMIVSLCSSFLISDSMFVLAWILHITHLNHILSLCKLVAVVMHLASLLAYIFNVLISYDMMSRFTISTAATLLERSFKISVIFAVSLSCISIAIALLCDYLDIAVTGYGSSGICLPHEFQGRMYFYILPIAISFMITFVCLLRVLFVIRKEKKIIEDHLKDSPRGNTDMVKIALKLTLILGAIESVGFIQIVQVNNTDTMVFNLVVSLLYTLVRSLRGLMLFIVFACRRDFFQHKKNMMEWIQAAKNRRRENTDEYSL